MAVEESILLPERSSRRRNLSGNRMDDSKAIVLLKILIYVTLRVMTTVWPMWTQCDLVEMIVHACLGVQHVMVTCLWHQNTSWDDITLKPGDLIHAIHSLSCDNVGYKLDNHVCLDPWHFKRNSRGVKMECMNLIAKLIVKLHKSDGASMVQ